uniref:Ionotropic receptor 75a1 n=1 Tax=Streltzoviella insularis TaxID=1206366 RepID=A0A7D5YVK1_9NEOP|nr:ionotropic receptor 75a1 [Streltzoviella insularis]
MWYFIYILLHLENVIGLRSDAFSLAFDYYSYREVKYLCYLTCDNHFNNKNIAKKFVKHNVRVSVGLIHRDLELDLERLLYQWDAAVGVMLDGSCDSAQDTLKEASKSMLLGSMHMWLVLNEDSDNCTMTHYEYTDETFQGLNLSIDADVIYASNCGSHYELTDVFNFGRIQGNNLEKNRVGVWTRNSGLLVSLKGFKYYNRWDFHNLTLRAVSVILDQPKVFYPEMLSEEGHTPGVSSMTKVGSQLLNILKLQHNFRFNYTIVGRWIGSPERNSTLAVTNSLYWREQDISSTCTRLFPAWLQWMDPFFPPATYLEYIYEYIVN